MPINDKNKHDGGKTRLDLVSPRLIEAVGKIRTYGVEKYGDSDSWKEVEPYRYVGATMRHFEAYRKGEELDKESGMPHLWHCACNLMFLIDLAYEDKPQPIEICKNCSHFISDVLEDRGTCSKMLIRISGMNTCHRWEKKVEHYEDNAENDKI